MNLCREKTGREDASQHATTKKCLSGTPRAGKTAGQQREDPRRLECHFALFRNRPPYLLKGMSINRSNQVWCADITYIPVCRGFLYLVAVMDWASRHVLAWRLSNTLDAGFCVEALDEALTRHGQPEIFNTDQGSQFTGFAFTGRLQAVGVRISMDGRGRCMDNIFIERLWRSMKYEAVYLHDLADGFEARLLIDEWIGFYNTERPHSALDGKTPAEAYRSNPPVDMMDKLLRALPTPSQAQQQRQADLSKEILAV